MSAKQSLTQTFYSKTLWRSVSNGKNTTLSHERTTSRYFQRNYIESFFTISKICEKVQCSYDFISNLFSTFYNIQKFHVCVNIKSEKNLVGTSESVITPLPPPTTNSSKKILNPAYPPPPLFGDVINVWPLRVLLLTTKNIIFEH